MRAADTNVIVRILAQDDPKQLELAERFIEGGAWVSIIALAEAIWVFRSVYGRSTREISDGIERLLKHEDLTLQDSDAVALALALFRSRPSLRFADCLMLELARKYGHLPLGTFDRDLAKSPGAQKL